ncbi:MAG: hypothetical protein MI723_03545, partial [Caulobacterales bacterium]|nr:hypothetical protein [Caulobacterales bacterium]
MLLWGGGIAGLAALSFGAHKSGLLPASYESDLSYAPGGGFGAGDKHFFYNSEIPEYQVIRYMAAMDANSGSWGDYAQFIRRTQKPFNDILSKVIPDFESFSRLWVENWFDIAEKR